MDSQAGTALIAAAAGGALETAKILVSARADLGKPCEQNHATNNSIYIYIYTYIYIYIYIYIDKP